MRASVFFSGAFAAVVAAQSSSVDPYPQTTLLQFTNSLGVVTGQPPVATSQPAANTQQPGQPAVVTSQPLPANIPAVGSGIHTLLLPGTGSAFNSTRTVVVSANNSTTVQLNTAVASASGSAGASGSGASRASGASGSPTSSGSAGQQSQAGAPNVKIAAGSVLGFGAFVAAFL